jgi:hypothetical protein
VAVLVRQVATMNTELLNALTNFTSPGVFNPWRDSDPLDHQLQVGNRLARLKQHFNASPKWILIGEAPGYKGCHFSGVPFTNERLILNKQIPRIAPNGRLTTRELPFSESSATIVWRALHEFEIADHVVMWNAFAWHPYKADQPKSNRTPSREELKMGKDVLCEVLKLFPGVPVIPVGRKSEEILDHLNVTALPWIRHPANGGATLFREGLRARITS